MRNIEYKTALSLILLGLLLNSSFLFGAIGDWQNFTYSDDSNDIVADSQFIWCATTGGLIRYDIETGELKKFLNSDGLGDIELWSVEIDTAGALFAGGSNGTITKITADGEITVYDFEYDPEVHYGILDIISDGEKLWVATEVCVAEFLIYRHGGEFRDKAVQLGEIPRGIPVSTVQIIGDYLWAGTDSGVAFIDKDNYLPQDPQNWHSYCLNENGLTNASIYSIDSVADTVFIGTGDGVFMFGQDSIWYNIGPASVTIYALENLGEALYAVTDGGIYRRYASDWELLPDDGLLSLQGRGITQDAEGNIWAAFHQGGISIYNQTSWDVFTIPGPAKNFIIDIAIDSSRNIWLAHTVPGYSCPQGVSKFDGTNWYIYNSSNSGIGNNGAVAVEYDVFHDLVWFGSWGDGLFSFDGDTLWVNFDETNSPYRGLIDAPFYVAIPDIAIDDRGNVWGLNLKAANPEVVMAVFDPGDSVWLAYYENLQEQIHRNYQFAVHINDNNTYVGGEYVYRLDFGYNSTDTTDDEWFDALVRIVDVSALAIDRSGKLFVGSASGLIYYDFFFSDTFSVELPDGYRSAVNTIEIDGLGNKWIGTDSGVVVLAKNNIAWIDSFKTSNSFLIKNEVQEIEIDKTTGIIYIGTPGGLSIYESGFAAASPDLKDMDVYPNPVYAKTDDARVNFLRVPADAEIFIYTTAGELVRRFNYENTNYWDLLNEGRQKVAAGIYIFYVRSGQQSGTGKIAVIR
jgi:ligand-binding sensor domain-containing protein